MDAKPDSEKTVKQPPFGVHDCITASIQSRADVPYCACHQLITA